MSENFPVETGSNHEVVTVDALGTLARAEIDSQIATAKRYPRSIATFRRTAREMATLDEETAASCFYSVPRGGKHIQGPSVRLAEIVGSAWGNVRYGARIIGDDGRILTAQGICSDLERNVVCTVEVQRRVTDRQGRRFNDDMVVVTGNAACAIALRNAILRVIPGSYVKEILGECKRVAIGDAKTLASKRAEVVAYFSKMGVSETQVVGVVSKQHLEEIGLEDLATLRGLATAIRDGDTTIEESFPPAKTKAEELKERLAKSKKTEPEPEKEAAKEEPPNQQDLNREDLARRYLDMITEMKTIKDLEGLGAEMKQDQMCLGGLFPKVLEAFQARGRVLQGKDNGGKK